MKELKIRLDYRDTEGINYKIDALLSIGVYQTTSIPNLNHNYNLLKSKFKSHIGQILKLKDVVIFRAKDKNGKRIDFLITEDVCFESLELISNQGFDGQFYDDFVEAFDMLETNQFDDEIWYN